MVNNILLINPTGNIGDLIHEKLGNTYELNLADNSIFDKRLNLHKMVKDAKSVVLFLNYPINIIRPLLVKRFEALLGAFGRDKQKKLIVVMPIGSNESFKLLSFGSKILARTVFIRKFHQIKKIEELAKDSNTYIIKVGQNTPQEKLAESTANILSEQLANNRLIVLAS